MQFYTCQHMTQIFYMRNHRAEPATTLPCINERKIAGIILGYPHTSRNMRLHGMLIFRVLVQKLSLWDKECSPILLKIHG